MTEPHQEMEPEDAERESEQNGTGSAMSARGIHGFIASSLYEHHKLSTPWHFRFSHPLSDSLRVWYLGNILPTHLVTSLCMFRTACSEPLAAVTPLRHSAALQASLSGLTGDVSRMSH
ncbi:hypothetical protein SRHO_G00318820 [Serrasalmus rhombeus]